VDRPSTKSHWIAAGQKKKKEKEKENAGRHRMVTSAAVSRGLQKKVARKRWRRYHRLV
jgi:hypothetical protein